jgi:RimJ/RimL family protein N-acetyltransferase
MQPPRLRTARLLLREFRPEDVEPHFAMSQDEEVQRFLGGLKSGYDAFGNLATHAGHWALRGYGGFVVERLEDGAFLGRVGFHEPPGWPQTEVGWKLSRASWGHGYATEAARAVIGFGFTALDMPELCSLIDPANAGSAAVAQRLGYVDAGPVETPFGIADRWVIQRGRGDAPWAFRGAVVGDAPRLGENLRAAMRRFRDISPPGWTAPQPSDDELRATLADPEVRCTLAEPGGVLAGHVIWRPAIGSTRGPDDPAAAYLGQLYVEPAWWGSPLATTLMHFALEGAAAAGFTRIHLVTPAASGRARRFYERLGFLPTGPTADDLRFGMPTIEYAREL